MSRSKKNIQPWIVMLAIGLISATSLGSSMVLMGSFLPSLAGAMHASVATISYYYTIIVLVMAAMMQVVPTALVKVNNTVIYLAMTTLVGVSLFAIGHVTSLWVFFILAAVIGICVSFMNFVPVGILIDNWFNEQVGLATGICWAITSVFQGIMSPLLSTWIASMGWQGALNILAIIALVVGIPCSFFIKFTPELAGAKPFGHKEQEEDEAGVQQAATKAVLHSAAFWIVTLLMCVLQFPSVANQMFPTYAAAVGFKATVGGFMVTAAMIFDIFLNPLFGSSADKFGAEKASLGWMTVGLVSLILLVVATNAKAAGLAIFAAGLNDIIYVFLGTGITALAQAIFGPRAFAKGFSMVGTVSFVVGAFAMPVNNMIAEKFGGFNAVFIFFGILMVVSMILVMIGSKKHFEEK